VKEVIENGIGVGWGGGGGEKRSSSTQTDNFDGKIQMEKEGAPGGGRFGGAGMMEVRIKGSPVMRRREKKKRL